MKVWLVSSVVLFILVQFILWLANFFVPLPFYILGGACLALASNYNSNLSNLWSAKTQNGLSSMEQNSHE